MKDVYALFIATVCHPLEDLLDKNRTVSVHVENVKTLAIEMLNVSNKLTLPLRE